MAEVNLKSPEVQSVVCERIRRRYPEIVIPHDLELTQHVDILTDAVVYQLQDMALQRSTSTSETRVTETWDVPTTWWEHLKHQHAPKWFKRRWPVRYQRIDVKTEITNTTTNVCPHIAVPSQRKHVEFMLYGPRG